MRKALFAFLTTAGILAGLYFAFVRNRPPLPMPISLATTHVLGPLDERGDVDFETALNERLSEGVTPETNAAVLLCQALGPFNDAPDEFYLWLGMKRPTAEGNYFVTGNQHAREAFERGADIDPSDFLRYRQQPRICERPWRAADFPIDAEWIARNEGPLELAIAATRLPHYYRPVVSRDANGDKTYLYYSSLHLTHCSRELNDLLMGRAMMRVGEGDFEGAWQDLLACLRLGRLQGLKGCCVDVLMGIAIESDAVKAVYAYLATAPKAPSRIRRIAADLRELPPRAPIANAVDLTERLMCLEAMQRMRWEGIAFLLQYSRDPHALKPFKNILRDGLALSDWNSAFVDANYWYDRQVTALRLPSRFDSLQELKRLRSEFDEELDGRAARDDWEDGFHLSPQTLLTEKLGSIVAGAVSPAVGQTRDIADRGQQNLAIFECAISLELYRTERGAYPRTLDDLAPGYMAVVPRDFFTEEPLIYRLEPNGYVLYSLGPNGKDEGLRRDLFVDDIGVRMPPEIPR